MSEDELTITVHIDERPIPEHPCALGHHAWAWLTAGGMECARCGTKPNS